MNDYSEIFINADAAKIMERLLTIKAKYEGKTDIVITCRDITPKKAA